MTPLNRRTFVSLGAAVTAAPLLAALPASGSATQAATEPSIRLNYNESPLGPSPLAREAMRKAVDLSGFYHYEQQGQLVQLFARQNDLPVPRVRAFSGSREALQYALCAFTKPGSLVLATPTYDAPAIAARQQNLKVHEVPLTAEHAHDIPGMLAAGTDAGLFYLCNPNNPTGTLTSRQGIERLVAEKAAHAVVVIDEAYIHFSDAQSCLDLASTRNDVIVLHTFSKLYGMAGARLGLAVGHPDLLARMRLFGGGNFIPVGASLGGIASLRDADLVPQRKHLNAQVREQSMAWFASRGLSTTRSHCNCFMVDLRQPAQPIVDALAQHKVLVGRVWPNWPDWMRITVGSANDMSALHRAFAAVTAKT